MSSHQPSNSINSQVSSEDKIRISRTIDSMQSAMKEKLREYVSIPSVSSCLAHFKDVHRQLETTKNDFIKYTGAEMWIVRNPEGERYSPDGDVYELPGILLGNYPKLKDFDKNKPTVLIYGHLDVQPAQLSDGWDTPPWILTEINGKLYGRGSTDDKGPIVGWLFALICLQQLGLEPSVNLKFCFEGMEEYCSIGLKETIMKYTEHFNPNLIDGVCISDNYWLGLDKPCLSYGLRGACSFHLTIEGMKKDLHSGQYGGAVYEPAIDLMHIGASLVDNKGKILIPGIYDDVKPLTEEEVAMYDKIDFDHHAYADVQLANLTHPESKNETLYSVWRYPSLSIHGYENMFFGVGDKTIIPRKPVMKFSIRTVANMRNEDIIEKVEKHIINMKEKLNTPNNVYLSQKISIGNPLQCDPNNFLYQAAKIATKSSYGVEPDMIREGSSIPPAIHLSEILNKPCCLIPMGAADDGAH